jgi:hypothetical protein
LRIPILDCRQGCLRSQAIFRAVVMSETHTQL